jgi:hypothetical protein
MTTRNGKRNVTNRFEAVTCQACGRRTARKSRQQRYCSDRCRKFAARELETRTAVKSPSGYQDSGPVREPLGTFRILPSDFHWSRAAASHAPALRSTGFVRPDRTAQPKLSPGTIASIPEAKAFCKWRSETFLQKESDHGRS